jgi:hypothetical protein
MLADENANRNARSSLIEGGHLGVPVKKPSGKHLNRFKVKRKDHYEQRDHCIDL